MTQMMAAVSRLLHRDDGQDLIEYGLLVALIALVCLAGVTTIGSTIQTVFWNGIGQAV
jgi:pilus assembly protein Flp/PilA